MVSSTFFRTLPTCAVMAFLFLGAGTAHGDASIRYGPGRDDSTLEMLTLFNRDSTPDEWISWELHAGRIRRQRKDSVEAVPLEPGEDPGEWQEFPFYGFGMAVGHTSLNPYILILLGGSRFEKLSHRLGTNWNFHLGLEFGSHGPEFGWFLALHHWSNGPQLTGAPGPNPGEEFGTFGLEWRF